MNTNDDSKIFIYYGHCVAIMRFCDYTDYELGEMADIFEVYINGQLHESGYGTIEIAERAAKRAIEDGETTTQRRARARAAYRQDMRPREIDGTEERVRQ